MNGRTGRVRFQLVYRRSEKAAGRAFRTQSESKREINPTFSVWNSTLAAQASNFDSLPDSR